MARVEITNEKDGEAGDVGEGESGNRSKMRESNYIRFNSIVRHVHAANNDRTLQTGTLQPNIACNSAGCFWMVLRVVWNVLQDGILNSVMDVHDNAGVFMFMREVDRMIIAHGGCW